MRYRADIDGLRAIAVLAVVIFHLGVPGFAGGYVGVDVFFVISGYLITSIIKDRHEQGAFTYADFYSRRIRRLVPPLIATVLLTVIAAAFLLTPFDMVPFGRSAAAALVSLSNFVFYSEAGYWDTASELKPLLHTWSLGLEEQFYLIWPTTVLLLLAGRRRITFGASLSMLALGGLALCVWYTSVDASAAFYLLPFRVFQFAFGALVIPLAAQTALRSLGTHNAFIGTLQAVGLALVLASVFLLDGETLFPGWAALWPTLGSSLLLLAGAIGLSRGPFGVLLDNPASLWIGRVSYSMYLVHWPIVALYRYANGAELAPAETLALALLTLLATALLHYGVERRFYQRAGTTSAAAGPTARRYSAPGVALTALLVGLLPVSAWLGDGWAWRAPNLTLTADAVKEGMQARFQRLGRSCSVRRFDREDLCDWSRPIQVLVFGNSHEPDGYNFLAAGYGDDPEVNLINFGTTNRCRTLEIPDPAAQASEDDCEQRLQTLFRAAFVESLDIIFYAANQPFAANKEGLYEVLAELRRRNPRLRIITLGGYINTRQDCWRLINATGSARACADANNVSYFGATPDDGPLFAKINAITDHFIDRVSLLCTKRRVDTCQTSTPEGIPAFYDSHHLSFEFASMAGRRYAKQHPQLLHNTGSD